MLVENEPGHSFFKNTNKEETMKVMKGGFMLFAGVMLVIFVFSFIILMIACLMPLNRESMFCKPIEPLLSFVSSLIGL